MLHDCISLFNNAASINLDSSQETLSASRLILIVNIHVYCLIGKISRVRYIELELFIPDRI
eukprot:Gb_34577 [translate_table: standard]